MLIIFKKSQNKKLGENGSFAQFSTCQNQNDDYICILDFLTKDNN